MMPQLLMLAAFAMLLVAPPQAGAAGPHQQLSGPPAIHAIFAGLSDGRVYLSNDGGATWQESDAGMAGCGAVYPLIAGAVRTIYAAPGACGVYRSTDGGRSWRPRNGRGGPSASAVYGLAVDPGDGRRIYAVSGDGTFYRSSDGGGNWQSSTVPLDEFWSSSANALQVDPLRPDTILLTSAGGMVLSTDTGSTWHAVAGMPDSENVYGAAFSGADPNVAYAATADGVYQTIDGGLHWERETRGIPSGTILTVVAVDPQHPSSVIACSQEGMIFRSTDGGTSWRPMDDIGRQQPISLAFDLAHPGIVLASTADGALYVSRDSGAHWSYAGKPFGPDAEINSLAGAVRGALPTDPVAPPAVAQPGLTYVAQTEHTIAGPFLTFYNQHGGLRIFGLALTEAFIEHGHTVQFFERAEMIDQHGFISLAPLGDMLTGHAFPPAQPSTRGTCNYEVPTRHNICEPFLSFWDTHDGPLLFGLPISEPFHAQNGDGTGRAYLVQYFKNARLEYHPELAGTSYVVSVGLLGREALERRGWL